MAIGSYAEKLWQQCYRIQPTRKHAKQVQEAAQIRAQLPVSLKDRKRDRAIREIVSDDLDGVFGTRRSRRDRRVRPKGRKDTIIQEVVDWCAGKYGPVSPRMVKTCWDFYRAFLRSQGH
jgi:hypothetical protein